MVSKLATWDIPFPCCIVMYTSPRVRPQLIINMHRTRGVVFKEHSPLKQSQAPGDGREHSGSPVLNNLWWPVVKISLSVVSNTSKGDWTFLVVGMVDEFWAQ